VAEPVHPMAPAAAGPPDPDASPDLRKVTETH
jgi:hypothetical protein